MVTLVSPTLGRHFGQLLGRFLENHRDPLKRISWLLLADLRTLRIELRASDLVRTSNPVSSNARIFTSWIYEVIGRFVSILGPRGPTA